MIKFYQFAVYLKVFFKYWQEKLTIQISLRVVQVSTIYLERSRNVYIGKHYEKGKCLVIF